MFDILEIAILAYRHNHFEDAASLFEQAVINDAGNWLARLYLAMCFRKLALFGNARRQLQYTIMGCPDQSLKEKAEIILKEVESEFTMPGDDCLMVSGAMSRLVFPSRRTSIERT